MDDERDVPYMKASLATSKDFFVQPLYRADQHDRCELKKYVNLPLCRPRCDGVSRSRIRAPMVYRALLACIRCLSEGVPVVHCEGLYGIDGNGAGMTVMLERARLGANLEVLCTSET